MDKQQEEDKSCRAYHGGSFSFWIPILEIQILFDTSLQKMVLSYILSGMICLQIFSISFLQFKILIYLINEWKIKKYIIYIYFI